jgi:peptidoglycan/xylan/chitin deacetylase (PgdA/CDA1 family)
MARAGWVRALASGVGALLVGCASPPPAPAPVAAPAPKAEVVVPPPAPWPQASGSELARNERLLIYRPGAVDTYAGIATRFLGTADKAWWVADANAGLAPELDVPLIVPLKPLNPTGVLSDRYQTVPILCYHRFGPGNSKMVISPANFAAQLEWLARNDYKVIRLGDLAGFLSGERPLPRRAVVITIDDGYESVHRHAFPLLRKYGFPATLFVYTDFVGAGDALSWAQLQEMQSSGLVDLQSHSKSHRNLIDRGPGESDERYKQNIEAEMRVPRDLIERRVSGAQVRHLAFPFGDANELVLESAARHGFQLAGTVIPGGNGFFAQPLMLRRTMIFGDLSLDGFRSKLQTSRGLAMP